MKILIIASYLPYPLHSGGQVRLYNLIKELSHRHEITLICEKRSHQTHDDINELAKFCKEVITVPRRTQWSFTNLFKSIFSLNSFLITGHTHPGMRQKIQETLATNSFDVIHVETFYVRQNVGATNTPIVLADHNIEYLIYRRFVASVPFIFRPLLSIDVAKIKREEETSWKSVTKVIAVSEDDKKVMEEEGINPVVVPNGVDFQKFAMKEKHKEKERRILFLGDFTWIQNKDSVKFIIEEVWPPLQQGFGGKTDLKLWIVGRKIPESIRQLTNDPSVIFDEKSSAQSTEKIFQQASLLLAPIRVGGGTSYKILESMACGTPVVTMQMSADAIGAKDGEELLVGQTAKELAEKTTQLLEDNKLHEKISKRGRSLIEKKYSWKEIAKILEKTYEDVLPT